MSTPAGKPLGGFQIAVHPHKADFLEKRKILFVKEPERSAELELGVGAAQLLRCSAYIRVSRAEGLRPLATSENE